MKMSYCRLTAVSTLHPIYGGASPSTVLISAAHASHVSMATVAVTSVLAMLCVLVDESQVDENTTRSTSCPGTYL